MPISCAQRTDCSFSNMVHLAPWRISSHGYMSCAMGRTLTHSACCDHHMQGAFLLMVVTFKFLLDTQMQACWRLSSQLPAYTHGTLAS